MDYEKEKENLRKNLQKALKEAIKDGGSWKELYKGLNNYIIGEILGIVPESTDEEYEALLEKLATSIYFLYQALDKEGRAFLDQCLDVKDRLTDIFLAEYMKRVIDFMIEHHGMIVKEWNNNAIKHKDLYKDLIRIAKYREGK